MTINIKSVPRPVFTEKSIENFLTKGVAKLGGTAYKFNSEQRRAVPDRICVLPGQLVVFVECKRPGAKPTAAQRREINRLRDLGQLATWVSTLEEVKYLLKRLSKMPGMVIYTWKELRRDND